MKEQLIKTTEKIKELPVKYKLIKPNKMSNPIDLSSLSAEELEAALATKKKKEANKLDKARKAYEAQRDDVVMKLVKKASEISALQEDFKALCHEELEYQAKELANYGKMRSNSKGGFSITNKDNDMRVTRRRDTQPVWDERSTKAIELIKDFLTDTIKKRDLKLYEILIGFLERNQNGDLEYSRVMDLYQHEDKYEDARWKEGLRLIKESFHNHFKGYGYEFKTKDANGKFQTVQLNFSSI